MGRAIEGMAHGIGIASLQHLPAKEQFQRLVEEMNDLAPDTDLDQELLTPPEKQTARLARLLAAGRGCG